MSRMMRQKISKELEDLNSTIISQTYQMYTELSTQEQNTCSFHMHMNIIQNRP